MGNIEGDGGRNHVGVHSLRNSDILSIFNKRPSHRFVAVTTEEQKLRQPIPIYIGTWVTHWTIADYAQQHNPAVFPIAAGRIDLQPQSVTVEFFPSGLLGANTANTKIREGLNKIKETDQSVIEPVMDSIREAFTRREFTYTQPLSIQLFTR